MGEGYPDGPARDLAIKAYIAAGRDPAPASHNDTQMIAAISAQHGAWLWAPASRRIAEEAYWRGRGIWPRPKDPAGWPRHLRPKFMLPAR